MLCKIGDVEIWRILEINGPYLSPEELFPKDSAEAREKIGRYAPDQLCPKTGGLILPIQGFLLKTPSQNILVDSCVGNDKSSSHADWNGRSDNRFMAALLAAGTTPENIDYVMCTHLHTDHVGWNTRLQDGRWVPTFPNAKYLIPEADNQHYQAEAGDSYLQSVLPVIEAGQAEFVSADHMLGDHVALVNTHGHTPGHVSVLIKSASSEAVITGDAIHTTAQCWHPDWHFKSDWDCDLAVQSRRKLLEETSESGCVVLGTHFALPSIGRVRANGDAFRWEAD
ncbi:MAG: MBL fold metallo-hydrolase [Pseudomonadota bacterium]